MYREIGDDASKIKETIESIKKTVCYRVNDAREKVANLKQTAAQGEKNILDENANLVKEAEGIRRVLQQLQRSKENLNRQLGLDENEMAEIEKENSGYKQNERDLQNTYEMLEQNICDIEEDIENLMVRKFNLGVKFGEESRVFLDQNELYKKYCGLDIKRIRNNVVKIYFRVEGRRCWALFDLALDRPLVESEPALNAESLNILYQNDLDFYGLVKSIRKECKRRM